MYCEEVIVQNEMGLHARPAQVLVKESSKFQSEITMVKKDRPYNAKSIISVMSMGAMKGDKITLEAEGKDEKEAVKAIASLIKSGFGE
ncbi:HPr family phosphocarrier protein [Crassaminicella profunda]|uniref:HPr family phosphocarrier protein n=1 Tax=Crassaminicella profunda TaxID=1286698 RepID=UPI001CA68F83|nr:HPr family phosphocarrier protein [Crassaminicella profunda]QZY55834.1 HPr family phosphocarrier protein [Crassaminicella profunda]